MLFIEVSGNIGENIGCCNGFVCFVMVGVFVVGVLFKLCGNYMV